MAEKKPEPAAPAASGAPAPAAPPASAKGGGLVGALLPAIIALVVAPAATFGVAHFVLLPRFEASLAHALAGAPEAASAEGGVADKATGHGGKAEAAVGAGNSYAFENVVVNLAGTMGTRYLKTSFLVTGERADVVSRFEGAKARLGDVTLGVLSQLTLADLEEPGSKNILRERLLAAYNQALGGRVVDQLFFSEFVVQ